uniref:Uncharacterized protein n=1 Tax=viral metagenome TaxID=1070528 RepID=A0A6C0IC11_9ZZZZ
MTLIMGPDRDDFLDRMFYYWKRLFNFYFFFDQKKFSSTR